MANPTKTTTKFQARLKGVDPKFQDVEGLAPRAAALAFARRSWETDDYGWRGGLEVEIMTTATEVKTVFMIKDSSKPDLQIMK